MKRIIVYGAEPADLAWVGQAIDEAARVRGDGDLVAVTNRGLGMKSSVPFTEKSVVVHLEKETPA